MSATLDLPQPGDTGQGGQSFVMLPLILTDFVEWYRTWPDQTHLTLKDVEQLREFVQARFAQNAPNWSDAGVARQLESRGWVTGIFSLTFDPALDVSLVQCLIGILVHRTE